MRIRKEILKFLCDNGEQKMFYLEGQPTQAVGPANQAARNTVREFRC